MINFSRFVSIRLKIIFIQFLISVLAIGLCSFIFYISSIRSVKKNQEENLKSLAQVIAKNSKAPLQFGLQDAATGLFSELKFDTNITNALILDKNKSDFATYDKEDSTYTFNKNFHQLGDGIIVEDGLYLNYYYPILDETEEVDEKYLGLVALRRYNIEYLQFKNQYILTILGAMSLGLLLSLILSVLFQRSISNPIKDLAEAARHISTTRDYTIKVKESGRDEITVLSQSFNEMVNQINARDQSLQEANDKLEHRVEERTKQLIDTNKVLEHRTKALEYTNRELEQFAYVTSHDLQEPLRSIGGFTQILQKKYAKDLDENAKEYMHYIVEGVSRMQAIIKDILVFSRLGRLGNEYKSVNINDVISMVLLNLQYAIANKSAKVTVEKLPETLIVDAGQISHLFQNLLSNALKFTNEETPPVITISAEELPDHWKFCIADNGIGIEQEFAEKIFLIFQRLHTKDKYAGTGIGLAICKKIVEVHQGKIWFTSELGKGTNFFFTIKKNLNDG